MIKKSFYIFIIMFLAVFISLPAQESVLKDTVKLSVTMSGLASKGQYAPFWLQSLNYGREYHTPNTAWASVSVFKDYGKNSPIFDYAFKADILARTDMEINGIYAPIKKEFYFHEFYAKAKLMSLQLIAGAQEEIIGNQDSTLSAGGFIFSKNARPIPKITLGFPQFIALPSTNQKILIKGAVSHGWFLDDTYIKATDVLLHHKYLYLRVVGSDYPVWVEAGVEHFAMWAGKKPNGQTGNPTLINFIRVFFGKQGGSDASKTDQINAYGNHMLSQSVKAGADLGDYKISAYWQNYNEDGPMRFFWGTMNKEDGLFGLSIKNKRNRLLQGFLYEFFTSTDQSGPYHDKDGMIYGGSDNYFSNDYGSWSYFGRTVGIPFISSTLYTEKTNNKLRGTNNMIRAHHIGIEGNAYVLDYRLLASYTMNYGTPKILYSTPRPNTSLLLELNRNWGKGFQTTLSMGADIGNMYGNNYGAMFTIRKTGILFKLKSPEIKVNPLGY